MRGEKAPGHSGSIWTAGNISPFPPSCRLRPIVRSTRSRRRTCVANSARRRYAGQRQGDRKRTLDPDEPAFRAALIRIRKARGLFTERSDGVRFLTPTVFRATARIPGTVPLRPTRSMWPCCSTACGSPEQDAVQVPEERRRGGHRRGGPRPLAIYGLGVVALALLFGWLAR